MIQPINIYVEYVGTNMSIQVPLLVICRILGSGRPLRFEHWGARGDSTLYRLAPRRIART